MHVEITAKTEAWLKKLAVNGEKPEEIIERAVFELMLLEPPADSATYHPDPKAWQPHTEEQLKARLARSRAEADAGQLEPFDPEDTLRRMVERRAAKKPS